MTIFHARLIGCPRLLDACKHSSKCAIAQAHLKCSAVGSPVGHWEFIRICVSLLHSLSVVWWKIAQIFRMHAVFATFEWMSLLCSVVYINKDKTYISPYPLYRLYIYKSKSYHIKYHVISYHITSYT